MIGRPSKTRGLCGACVRSLSGVTGLNLAVGGGGSPCRGSERRDLDGWDTGANGGGYSLRSAGVDATSCGGTSGTWRGLPSSSRSGWSLRCGVHNGDSDRKTIDWRCRRHSWRGGIWRWWCSSGYSVSIMRASQGLQVISSSGFPHTFTSQDGQLYFVLVLTFLAVLASGS